MGTKHYTLLGSGGTLRVPALSTSSCRGGIGPPLLILEAAPHGVGVGTYPSPRRPERCTEPPRPGPLRAALGVALPTLGPWGPLPIRLA